MTQLDLLPAPDSLPAAPDTSSTDVGFEGMEGPEGCNVWSGTHRQQLQQGDVLDPPAHRHDGVVRKLAHPAPACSCLFAFLFFRFVPLFCPGCLAESQLLPATVCVFAFVSCVCVGMMMQQAFVQPSQWSASHEFLSLLSKATSALVNI